MKIGQWRYFLKWFFAVALFIYIASVIYLFGVPKVYETTTTFEVLELYPGENTTPPTPPEDSRISFEVTPGTRLIQVTARNEDPGIAANSANNYVGNWFTERRIAYREKLAAEQASLAPESAEWRRLEIERRIPIAKAGSIHGRANYPIRPSSPDIDRFLAFSLAASSLLGLLIAYLMTRRRGDQENDGAEISWNRIGRRFGKIAIIASLAYLLISLGWFVFELRPYTSAVTLKLPESSKQDFETRLRILKSPEALQVTIRELDLMTQFAESVEADVVDVLTESIEVQGDREQSTAEIRFEFYQPELTEQVPVSIARTYSIRLREAAFTQTQVRKKELEILLRRIAPDTLLSADIQTEIERLKAIKPQVETAEILSAKPAERAPKDWIGWLIDVARIEVLHACTLAAAITLISLLWFSAEARAIAKKKSESEKRVPLTKPITVSDPY